MSFDATNLIGGPAIVTFDGATFYSEEDVRVRVTKETKEDTVAAFGKIDETLLDVMAEITFRPAMFKDTDKLWPYFAFKPGQRLFGNTDKPVVITSMTEGRVYTYARGAITSLPNLGLGVTKTLMGDVTITALKANATALHAANSIVSTATTAFADTTFDPTKRFDVPYTVGWGASPFNAMDTVDGVDVSFSLTFEWCETDQAGKVDAWFQDLTCEATFRPVGLTVANFLEMQKLQGTGVRRGAKLGQFGNDLVIAGPNIGDPQVTLYKAFVKDSGQVNSPREHLHDAVTLMCARRFSSGSPQVIAAIGTKNT